jgi:hypothetical protein
MKLENQVATLEQSKRLKELGVDAPTLFAYFAIAEVAKDLIVRPTGEYKLCQVSEYKGYGSMAAIPAPSVAELGVMLPTRIYHEDEDYFLRIWKGLNEPWGCKYESNALPAVVNGEGELETPRRRLFDTQRGDKQLAIVLATMLIRLLESGAITAEEVNQRLSNS